jgi:hypothetical protein
MNDILIHGFLWVGGVAGGLGPFICYFLAFVFVTALEGLTDLYWSTREPDE